jgi:hypothetical protein
MPLKSPRSRSSRVIVASAWNVERYWTFGAGFWNRYFTVGEARDRPLLQLFLFRSALLRKYLPVSNGNPTTTPETPATVPARKSRVGSSSTARRRAETECQLNSCGEP